MDIEEKITLDKSSFRALTSETRINIMKSLGRRRKTLSELSKEFNMSVSTIKEHLDVLCSAGLAVQKDDGHKWKYYELTKNGMSILNPAGDRKITVLLGISLLAMAGLAWDMLAGFYSAGNFSAWHTALGKTGELVAASQLPVANEMPYLHILGIIIFAAVFAACLILHFRRKNKV
jgi:DNA-binding transcriptional ArsR family regulator